MIADNEWHPGFFFETQSGYALVENQEEAENDPRPKKVVNGCVRCQEVRYNWNKGQPLVDFGDFQMTIVDSDWRQV